MSLQVFHLLSVVLSQDQIHFGIRELIGRHAVEGDAEFVGYQSAEVRNQAEDTDATGNGGWLGEEIDGR